MSDNTHSINLTFTTDRPITETELDTLKSQLIAQIEEPVTADGDDVDYVTKKITLEQLEKVKTILNNQKGN